MDPIERGICEESFSREGLVRDTIIGPDALEKILDACVEPVGFTREELRRDTYVVIGGEFPGRLVCLDRLPEA